LVPQRVETGNPLFHTSLKKLKINHGVAHTLYLFDLSAPTPRAALGFYDNYPIGSGAGATEFSMKLVDGFEITMGSDKNLLPLVVEIGALNDVFEIFQCVLSGTEHLPMRAVFSKFFRATNVRKRRLTSGICEIG
jgi:hypothetical protein